MNLAGTLAAMNLDYDASKPHDYDHSHTDVASGWLRASVFGAMDGLVSNIALITGIAAAGAPRQIVILTGLAGLVAGAISMALGEFTSVRTQNEQLESEVHTERLALARNPDGERAELAALFMRIGMDETTAHAGAEQVHADEERALRVHLTHELGLDPDEKPSPWVAALSSFAFFSIGAIIPLLPYLFGLDSLGYALVAGAVGLFVAGALATIFTKHRWWVGASRQLAFGAIAVTATYIIGILVGVGSL